MPQPHQQAFAAVLALAALVAVIACALAAPAAASPGAVIRDCSEDGVLDGGYSQSEIEQALEQLPSDIDEYTDCRSVIRGAQLGSAGRQAGAKRRPGVTDRVDKGAPASPGEERRISKATGSDDVFDIGGAKVTPGGAAKPLEAAGLGTDLPALLLVTVIGLAGALLAAAGFGIVRAAAPGGPLGRLGDGVRRGAERLRR